MKRMYDFGRSPAKRDYTVKDLKAEGAELDLCITRQVHERPDDGRLVAPAAVGCARPDRPGDARPVLASVRRN